jgi:hypothetical protein
VRVVEKTDVDMTPNPWVLSMMRSLSIHLDGQTITLRVRDEAEHDVYLKIAKAALGPMFLDKLDPGTMNGVEVEKVDDQGNPNDLVIRIDYSGYQEPNPLNLTGLRSLLHVWLTDIYFNDWNTTSDIKIRWVKDGLGVRIPFESKGHEVTVKKGPVSVKGNIDGFYLDLHVAPYIFWSPDLAPARDKTGKKMVNPTTGWPTEFWASGRGMYKQRCAVFVDFGWDSFSPNILGAEAQAKQALGDLVKGLPKQLPQELIFQVFETLLLGEKSLLDLYGPSKMRGIDIQQGKGRFLYLDEEAESFKGKGRIVAVRKDTTTNHLQKDEFGHLSIRKDYKGDNIIEVEIEDENKKRVRMSTLNLIESILDGGVDIENAHSVIRNSEWGAVATTETPWDHLMAKHLNMCAPLGAGGSGVRLKYNGYLRGNPDSKTQNNLDRLLTYGYDKSNPLLRNIYDGTFLFVYPDLTAFSGLQRTLYPRAWKLPKHDDRETKMLDSWM